VDGAAELVRAVAAAGIPDCVASSGGHDKMRRTLGRAGLLEHFEGRIFSATEVAHGKPAPDLFWHAAKQMGFEPAGCAVIEDSPFGVQAGVAAGMTVVGYCGGVSERSDLQAAGAWQVTDDLRAIRKLLQLS